MRRWKTYSKNENHISVTAYRIVYLTLFEFFLQNLPNLCSVSAECVSAFSVDFWLQTQMLQAGVLWHLLLYLFNYDYTLEESGVEKCAESNQQVSEYNK